jgi:predicted RNA-binding protein
VIGNTWNKSAVALAALGCTLSLISCESIPGPNAGDDMQFANDMSLLELANTLDIEAGRVEITLYREGVVVRELEIKSEEALATNERVQGRITDLGETEAGPYIQLNIEGLSIGYTDDTRVLTRDGEIDLATFLARVTAALAEGDRLAVEAERSPPDAPQAPDVEEFVAQQIKLLGEGEGRILELNIDRDNLIRNENPFPDGWIAVLNRQFELRIREGITHLEKEVPNLEKQRFEGRIESVDLDAYSFKIVEGPEVYVIKGETEIRYEDGDEHRLPDLEAVARAIEDGMSVFTAGYGLIRQSEPRVLAAIAVVFEVAPPPMEDFEGVVASVDLDDSTVTLEGDRRITIRITGETQFRTTTEDDVSVAANPPQLLGSLEEVAAAVDEGHTVVAAGIGIVVQEDPLTIEAKKIVFVVRPPPLEEFRGVVDSVDQAEAVVYLEDETQIQITDGTELWFAVGDEHRAGTLDEVQEALNAGNTVVAAGFGEVVSKGPLVIRAKKVLFIVEPPGLTTFEGVVASVDLEQGSFTLENETVVYVVDGTVIWFQSNDLHSLGSLGAVAEAVRTGETVVAAGVAEVESTEPRELVARKVGFFVVSPGIQHFEGVIESVNLEAHSFKLVAGPTIRLVEGSLIVYEEGSETLSSLASVADLVRLERRVTASGLGLLETSEPLVLIAIAVVFRI